MAPSKSQYQIVARATRIWEVAPNADAQPLSLVMVLLDSQGEHIHATIPRKWMRSFKEEVQEGRIYKLTLFEVAKNTKAYKPVHTNENIIKFTPFTTIIGQAEDSIKIQKHKFEFHKLDLLHERNNKTDYLIDVIGVLSGVENKTQVMTEKGITQIRNIYIEDERHHEVKTTLWGEAANYVSESDTKETEVTKIIVVTSARVARYQDEYQLKSTYGTKIYINLDIPEAKELLERIGTTRPVHQIENNTQQQTQDDMLANMKTLMELTEMEVTNPKQTFTCQGVISGIRTDVEWRYISCPTCWKGLDVDNICPKCIEEIPYPTQRYRIRATLDDGKSEASIVMFDKEAEKVIGKPIAEVLEISKNIAQLRDKQEYSTT